jgi:ketosteroid isomerase-like protein
MAQNMGRNAKSLAPGPAVRHPPSAVTIDRGNLMRNNMLLSLLIAVMFPAATIAQTAPASPSARAGIDAGNQAWIDGVKAGDVAPIIATYAPNAVDCGPAGTCLEGRNQIEQHMKTQLAKTGRARSASVSSWGSIQHGNFVYEWGQAQAAFDGGNRVVDSYLTVWQKQPDGSWKIFRNLVIPEK